MGIFSQSSPFDPIVEKATLETNTKDDWALILDICDRVGTSQQAPKECLRSIIRRLNNPDPHVQMQAITLLDACVSNCGLPFHLEIASREFEQEFRKLIQKIGARQVRDKILHCLQKWAENEFRSDPQLDLIPSFYQKLKSQGVEFPAESSSPSKSKKSHSHSQSKSKEHHSNSTSSNPANVARQEEEDLAKAIELSLKETNKSQQNRNLYPSVAFSGSAPSSSSSSAPNKVEKESRRVRALYDFEAAEDNELTFYAGEIVHVLDDNDPNWWEGTNQRGRGLFPSNFVTADLSAEPQKMETGNSTKKQVQFNEDVVVKSLESEPVMAEIDEAKIDQVLHILHDLDPTGESPDPPDLSCLEDQVSQMEPLIDQELEKIDRRHAQLTKLGSELVDALNMYHNLMRGQPMMNPGFPPQMAAKIPVSGPASMPNFQPGPGGMSPMMPGYSPYFDPSSMMGQNPMMRPPSSAPPGMYQGPGMQMVHHHGPGGPMPQMPPQQQQQQQQPPQNHHQPLQQQQQQSPQMQGMPPQQHPAQMHQHQQQLPPHSVMNNIGQQMPPGVNHHLPSNQQPNSLPPGLMQHQGY